MPGAPKGARALASEVIGAVAVDYSYRSTHRLRETDDFSSVFAFRKVLRGAYLHLLYRPNQGTTARLGMIVAKKFIARATSRNLVKRLGREAFRGLRSELPPCDLILRVAAPIAMPIDRKVLRREIDTLLLRVPK